MDYTGARVLVHFVSQAFVSRIRAKTLVYPHCRDSFTGRAHLTTRCYCGMRPFRGGWGELRPHPVLLCSPPGAHRGPLTVDPPPEPRRFCRPPTRPAGRCAVCARAHLCLSMRAGEGDQKGAWRLSLFVCCSCAVAAGLRAHRISLGGRRGGVAPRNRRVVDGLGPLQLAGLHQR